MMTGDMPSADDAWLFGWDPMPGIVSVWADHTGGARVWQRTAAGVHCRVDRFRPWLFAAGLDDLRYLGAALVEASAPHADRAPVTYQTLDGPPDSLRFLLSARDGRALREAILRGARRRVGRSVAGLRDLPGAYYTVGPVEQYLMATGRVYFRGLAYDDLHRLQFDLETTALSPRDGRIFLVAVRDSRGLETLLDAPTADDEAALIADLCALIAARDPDVIENHNLFGFDLPFLEARAAALGVPLRLGRAADLPGLDRFDEPTGWGNGRRTRYSTAGRELIDTLPAVQRHQFVDRSLPGSGLKAAARYFGVAAPARTYIPGADIYMTYQRDPERVRRYAFDDVREVDGLSRRLMGAPFALAWRGWPHAATSERLWRGPRWASWSRCWCAPTGGLERLSHVRHRETPRSRHTRVGRLCSTPVAWRGAWSRRTSPRCTPRSSAPSASDPPRTRWVCSSRS